jgi:tetratricopeptide (TPR) repeat protein
MRPTGPVLPADLDLDALLDGIAQEPTPTPARAVATAPIKPAPLYPEIDEPVEREPEPVEPASVRPPPEPLDIFDELVSTQEPAEPAVEEAVAGEVLPAAEPVKAPVGPMLLPLELEDLPAGEGELQPPPVPESLLRVDLGALQAPERGTPISCSRAYWQSLAELMELESRATDSSSRAAAMEISAARAYEELGEIEEALTHYREVLGHRPEHVPALRELRRLHNSRREQDQIADLLAQMAQRVGPEEKRALLFARAELLWSRAGDDAGAAAAIEPGIGAGHPDNLRALLLRADLACASGDDDELEEVLAQLASAAGDKPLASAVEVELGRLYEARGRASEAQAAYRRALEAEPLAAAHEGLLRLAAQQDPAALAGALTATAGLEGIWGARRRRRRARLIQHHKLQGDALAELEQARRLAPTDPLVVEDLAAARLAASDAAGALELLLELARGAVDPEEQAGFLVEAAQLAEHALSAPARALELYSEAITLAPHLPAPAIRRVETLQRSADAQHQLEAMRGSAPMLRGSERAAQHLRAAEILDEEQHLPEEAIEELLACLEHEPACRPALQRLERLYRQAPQLERLAAVLDTAAEAADDPSDVADLHERAAHLYEGPLGKPDTALRRHRDLAQALPDRLFVRLGLLRLLDGLGHHDDLAQELSLDASGASGPQAARIWTRCGDAWWAANRPEEAKAAYRMAVGKQAEHVAAAWRLVLWDASRKGWREVADIWTNLAEALGDRVSGLPLRLAGLFEHELADPAEAARWYRTALAAPGAREGLNRCLRRTRAFAELLEETQKEIDAKDPGQRFALLMLAGDLARRSGAEWKEAEARFRRALEESGRHPIARLSLEHLLAEQQAWQPLADLLMADLNEAAEVDARIRAYSALAELDLRRGDEESARLSMESIVELNPSHLPALRFLQRRLAEGSSAHPSGRLASSASDRLELAGALRREADASAHPADTAALWLELARWITAQPGGSLETVLTGATPSGLAQAARDLDARRAFVAALEADPHCILALRCLLDHAWMNRDREDQARFYEQLARAVLRSEDAAIYLTRAGELSTDDAARIGLFREALQRAPEFLGAIYDLRQAALKASDWAAAALAAEAEARASRVHEHTATASLLAGELSRRKLDDPERACTNFRSVLAAHPSNRSAFEALREHAELTAAWEELRDLLAARTEVERSRVQLVELRRALAAVCKDHLKDRPQAKQELQALLKLRPEDPDALATLADMHGEDEEWREAVDSLIRLARLERNPIALRDIFLRLGRIYQDNLPDSKRALASFNRVVTLDASHLEALGRLSDLYLQTFDFKRALATTTQLFEKQTDASAKVEHMLRIAKIHEDGLKDIHQAAICYRQAQELAPHDLRTIGELCGFFARHGDQRSLMVHLDRSVATMRARLKHDAFDSFAYHALFKIFGWRKAPDGCLSAAQVLEALGGAEPDEQAFIDTHVGGVGAPGRALGDPEHDEWLFQRSIPGGFRQVFQMLSDAFVKVFPGSLKPHGLTKSDRLGNSDHPVRRVGDALAKEFGVGSYEVYLSRNAPGLLAVENTDPPAILLGAGLLEEVTEEELQFIMGRCLWIIRKAMILPTRFAPADLEVLVAAVVRQYQPDFQPVGTNEKELADATRQVGKAIPKRIRQELMPFALECSGPSLRELGAAVVHSANRAGLLTSRSVHAALSVLRKAASKPAHHTPEQRVAGLRGNQEAEELLAFAVSDSHFELRRAMRIAIRL